MLLRTFIRTLNTCALLSGLLLAQAVAGIPPVASDGRVVSLAPMLAEVTPGVVNIAVTTTAPLSLNPLFNDPFFGQFFGEGFGGFRGGRGREKKQSAGSGVVISAEEGLIVTNHHVVSNANAILVTLKNKKTYQAKLIGVDTATDLAVIAIPVEAGDMLKAVKLGNSDEVEVGDFVAAIGNPFSIGQTVTSGIVSALGRSGLNIKHFEDFIQTDAAINPGNSGGALVNLKGELVGINTSIISTAGANVGIGFAIPVNMMKVVVDQIVRYGRVERGVFGVEIQDLTDQLAKTLGIPLREGAVLTRVFSGSQAEQAKLQSGDVVIELNDGQIRSANHLRSQLALIMPGALVELRIIREGQLKEVKARMGSNSLSRQPLKLRPKLQRPSKRAPSENNATQDASDAGWELIEDKDYVIVAAIKPQGLAAGWGVQEGDVLVAFNGKKIRQISDLPESFSYEVDITLHRGSAVLRLIRR